MRKTISSLLALLIIAAMVVTGCAQPTPTPAPRPTDPPAAPTQAPAAPAASGAFKAGMVTDVGGIDDKSFNATSWKGIEDAIKELGTEGRYLESQQQTDYAKNITELLQQNYDIIVTVGYLLGEDTAKFAQENPNVPFAIVDFAYDPEIPNVLGLTFATDQAAFMAGYVAASMTKTGKVGTFGGMNIPTVTIFMKGYEQGVAYYNAKYGTTVEVLGTDFYVGNFESTDDGRRAGESLMDEGADIIMPVAGPVGVGTAEAVLERGGMLIGVDTDWTVSAPKYADITLTSVEKNMDVAVLEAVKAAKGGTFKGGTYVGTLANNGVDISPFGKFDGQVPQNVKDDLKQIRADLIAGKIWTGWGEKPAGAEAAASGAEYPLGENVTLTFWHPQAPDSFRGQLMSEIIADFEAKYPEIKIEATFQSDYTNLYKTTVAAIAAGTPPDCAVAYPSMIADYLKADAVIALDDYIADPKIGLSAEDLADIYPGYLAECRFPQFGNKYYAFPFTKSALGMWYNMDLLKAAGHSTLPKTWDEFEQMCLDVKEKTGKYGYAYYESASTFDGWLYSRGAKQLNADETEATFNGPEGVESLALVKRLIDAGAAYKPEGSNADQAEFGKGNVAFTMASTSGTFYYKQAVEQGGGNMKEWGQTNIPQSDPSNPQTVMYGGSFTVFKTTEAKQKAAWLFLKFFTSTEQTAKWGSKSGYMPVRASAAALLGDYFASEPIAKEQIDTIVPFGFPEPSVRGEQEIRVFIEEAMTAAFEGIMEPQAALNAAVVKANEALENGRK
jgi:basic membrane protein A